MNDTVIRQPWIGHFMTACALVATMVTSACAGVAIVPFGSNWTYLNPQGFSNDPSFRDLDFDANWFRPGFDDSSWRGPSRAPFAYGTIDGFPTVATELRDPGDGDRYSAYFRHEFVTARPFDKLALEILIDDGAVVYLDGEEVLRQNCCVDELEAAGDDRYLNFATLAGNEEFFVQRPILDGQTLAPGNHLLAVSAHQVGTTSPDLGFEMRLLSTDAVTIKIGVDTTLASDGLNGPDLPHGAEGDNPDGVERWEWDGADGASGGENHGLLWFDIPETVLDGFSGKATLRLYVDNEGNSADVYRVTQDWLSGPDGGDNVTWNNVPRGPGLLPGRNIERLPSFVTGELTGRAGTIVEFDVTKDVMAWASGTPNYGWGFLPIDDNGTGIASFESQVSPVPTLELSPTVVDAPLQAGDANQDLVFDQLDLIHVLIAAKYLTGQSATWGEGDWDGAPGGGAGSPPIGDGVFNQRDVIAAQLAGFYLTGPYGAGHPHPDGEGTTTLVYDAATGELAVEVGGIELTSIGIVSAASIFTGDAAMNLGGRFDKATENTLFKATFGNGFHSLSFGNVAPAGLTKAFVLDDLTVVGSRADGTGLGQVGLIYVPEPSALMLLALGIAGLAAVVHGEVSSMRSRSCGT